MAARAGQDQLQQVRRGHGARAAQHCAGGEGHPPRQRAAKARGAALTYPLLGARRHLRPRRPRGPRGLLGPPGHRRDGSRRGAGVPGYVEGVEEIRREDHLRRGGLPRQRRGRHARRARAERPTARRGVCCLRYRDDRPAPGHKPHDGDWRGALLRRRDQGGV